MENSSESVCVSVRKPKGCLDTNLGRLSLSRQSAASIRTVQIVAEHFSGPYLKGKGFSRRGIFLFCFVQLGLARESRCLRGLGRKSRPKRIADGSEI